MHVSVTRLRTVAAPFLCLAIALVFAAGCSREERIIKIATKPMTEQFILGEMLGMLIEQDLGVQAALTLGVEGGTANLHPALVRGEFDLYPEYTGTSWLYVLKKKRLDDDERLLRELRKAYAEEFGLEWVGMYGFNNTYGLAVHADLATRQDLAAFSDLAALAPRLVFGAEPDFYEREDGYTALCEAYGYAFARHVNLDIGLKYAAIRKSEIDVINIFTTDGQLATGVVTVLRDDKHLYPTYYCGTVVRRDTLEKYPKLRDTLLKMEGLLTDEEMARLNYAVEVTGKAPRDVARTFLTNKGLLRF